MTEDASSVTDTALRDVLRRWAPDIAWLMVHSDTDGEAVLWVRVRAERVDQSVQFVVIVRPSENADRTMLAARIITEAVRLLSNKPEP